MDTNFVKYPFMKASFRVIRQIRVIQHTQSSHVWVLCIAVCSPYHFFL